MKLQTSIRPRRDGTVKVLGQDGKDYVFSTSAEGELTCDVADEATISALLATGNFWPENPDDFDVAEKLIADIDADGGQDGDGDGDGDGDDDEFLSAMPIEANTPPVRKKPGPKPKAK